MLCGISVFAGRWLVRQQPNAFHPASQYRVAQLGNRLLAREGLAPDQGDAPMRARWNERFGQQARALVGTRSEKHTSELQSLMPLSYAVFCLNIKKHIIANQSLSE